MTVDAGRMNSSHSRARMLQGLGLHLILPSISVLSAVFALPIAYAAVLPGARLETLGEVAFTLPVFLPALANATVMLASWRLQGRLDRKLAVSISRAILVHGSLAFLVLLARLDYSNQIMLLAMTVSVVTGPMVAWLRHAAYPSRVGLICPIVDSAIDFQSQYLDGVADQIHDPLADLSGFDVLLTPDITTLPPAWATAISRAMVSGTPVRHFADFAEERYGLTCVDHFDPEHLPASGLTSYRTRKRLLDLFLVVCALPIALPILAVAAVLIRITMGGPVLFVQERVGLGGRCFLMLKLRTMRPAVAGETAAATNATNAKRITPVGSVLRRHRIDELPQLWNVLVGDMSVIGPRPEWKILSDRYVAEFPVYAYRHLVRPGITGWAQVRGGYAADLAETREKVGYDLFYMKNLSFALDLQILVRTIWTLFKASGAR